MTTILRADERYSWKPGDIQIVRAHRAASAPSPLHRAATSLEPRIKVAIRYAFARGRAAIKGKRQNLGDLAAKAVAKALDEVLRPTLLAGLKAGGDVAVKQFRSAMFDDKGEKWFRTAKGLKTEVKFKFDATDENAVRWADRHAAELVTGISETTREDINNAVASLLETGDWEDSFGDILAAVGDDDRALLIARHESMTAVSEGQREAWDQAVEEGLLTGDEKRTWIVTPDDALCPICDGLDGQTASLDGTYTSDGEEYDGPPAHVACRCTEGLA
jgi:hypothetical protein